jgi:hypothetical protein
MTVLLNTGCSLIFRGRDVTPAGLTRGDDALRRMLSAGTPDTTLRLLDADPSKAPSDEVLRLLYNGLIAYQSARYDSSAAWFDRVDDLIEQRDVLWLTREAAAFLTNDRALPWQPSRTERLLIPYYGALSYLRTGNLGEAAVEARRLSQALQKIEDKPEGMERRLFGLLRYFAGTVFEANGDANDAAVAYRNAQELLGDSTLLRPASPDSGDLFVVLEDGFVAHRVEQSLTIVLADYEADDLHSDDRKRRDGTADAVAARAFAQALRPATEYAEGPRRPRQSWYVPAPPRDRSRSDDCTTQSKSASDTTSTEKNRKTCDDDDDTYILRLAWPGYHTVRRPSLSATVLIGDSARTPVPWFVSVSDAVVGDFERQRGKVLARTVARGAAKLALTKSAEQSVGEKHEGLGRVLGTIANVSTAVLEQADTRSWTLLPGAIGLIKLRLPQGSHHVRLEVGGGSASTSAQRIDLGDVQVSAGQTRFLTARYFR